MLYAEVVNATEIASKITGVEVDGTKRTMLHTTSRDSGGREIMTMVESVPLAPRATIRIAPGGIHGMIEGLPATLHRGDSVRVTFHLATGSVSAFARVADYADVDSLTSPRKR